MFKRQDTARLDSVEGVVGLRIFPKLFLLEQLITSFRRASFYTERSTMRKKRMHGLSLSAEPIGESPGGV